ncbi:MAG: SprT family zinc-dependent metalloprotease [Fimbriimonadaceae bacterium]
MADPHLRLVADQTFAELLTNHPLKRPARLEWRPYRVAAGMAYYKISVIGLSSFVLTNEDAVVDTLIHEYAHLLAYERAGKRGANHGPDWQAAMTELGRPPKVRHNYSVTRNAKRQEVGYQCLRCGETFIRSRRLPRRGKYVHATCGGDLRLAFIRARQAQPITEPPQTS